MGARTWVEGFLLRHQARFDPPNWPTAPEELAVFLAGFVAGLDGRGVTEAEAEAASVALMAAADHPRFRDEHLPRLLERVRADRDAARARVRWTPEAVPRDDPWQDLWDRLDDDARVRYREQARAQRPRTNRWPFLVEALAMELAYRNPPAQTQPKERH